MPNMSDIAPSSAMFLSRRVRDELASSDLIGRFSSRGRQQYLYFLPEPQGQGSFRPGCGITMMIPDESGSCGPESISIATAWLKPCPSHFAGEGVRATLLKDAEYRD